MSLGLLVLEWSMGLFWGSRGRSWGGPHDQSCSRGPGLVSGRGPGERCTPVATPGPRQFVVCTTIHLLLMHGRQACKAAGASRGALNAGHWRWLGLEARNIEHRNLVFTSDRPGP